MNVAPGRPFKIRPGMDLSGVRAVVMGLGNFSGGVETVRYLVDHGADVLVTDLRKKKELGAPLRLINELPVRLKLGGHHESDFQDADLVVVSPAVPPESRYLQVAADADVPIMTELSITMSLLLGPVAWVTGTCGKSTTTALLGEILKRGGVHSRVGGNIGRALVAEAESFAPNEVAVIEVSSFQLEWMARDGITPDLAVVTNLSPNHLDRHGTFKRYVEAKAAALPVRGPTVLNCDDRLSREHLDAQVKDDLFLTSLSQSVKRGAFLRGRQAVLSVLGVEEILFDVEDVKLLGNFNRMNALQAALAARLLRGPTGAAPDAIRKFRGLPHRLEVVGEVSGVRAVNDSKATTPEAAVRALRALDGPVVLIAGGFEREAALREFVDTIRQCARSVILLGASAKRMAKALGPDGPEVHMVDSMDEAVATGMEVAEPGDTLLLSPGHASWDMFRSYEERGDRFGELFLGESKT